MMLILMLMEEKMRTVSILASVVALSFGVALAAPTSALAADGAHPLHKHAIQAHRVAYPGLSSNATALASVVVSAVPINDADGLSRNSEDCNKGCIDH
jgi:hypothetical protein